MTAEQPTPPSDESPRWADFDGAVSALVAKVAPGTVTTRYVLVAEVIDEDGDRGSVLVAHEDARPWDVYGLLHHALSREDALDVIRRLQG